MAVQEVQFIGACHLKFISISLLLAGQKRNSFHVQDFIKIEELLLYAEIFYVAGLGYD